MLEEDVPGEQFVEIDGCQIDGLEEADLPQTPLSGDKVGNGLKLGGGPATQDGFTGDGVKVTKCWLIRVRLAFPCAWSARSGCKMGGCWCTSSAMCFNDKPSD